MKPVKGYRYDKWLCQGLAAKLLLHKTALNGPVPCVPSPLAQACGGEDILHIFFNISWTPWALDPITNPFLGPSSWLHPASRRQVRLKMIQVAGFSYTSSGDYTAFLICFMRRKDNHRGEVTSQQRMPDLHDLTLMLLTLHHQPKVESPKFLFCKIKGPPVSIFYSSETNN